MQKRTGVKDQDIDDFLSKADDVQNAIKALRDGTLKPEDVHVDGIDSLEELEEKEVRYSAPCTVWQIVCIPVYQIYSRD